jgi:hypothetical protein
MLPFRLVALQIARRVELDTRANEEAVNLSSDREDIEREKETPPIQQSRNWNRIQGLANLSPPTGKILNHLALQTSSHYLKQLVTWYYEVRILIGGRFLLNGLFDERNIDIAAKPIIPPRSFGGEQFRTAYIRLLHTEGDQPESQQPRPPPYLYIWQIGYHNKVFPRPNILVCFQTQSTNLDSALA